MLVTTSNNLSPVISRRNLLIDIDSSERQEGLETSSCTLFGCHLSFGFGFARDTSTMSGALKHQLNTLAGRSKTAAVVAAAARAAANHHGRTPSSTAAIASFARNPSSLAGCAGNYNSNDASRNGVSTYSSKSGGSVRNMGCQPTRASSSSSSSSTPAPADGGDSTVRVEGGPPALTPSRGTGASGRSHGSSGGGGGGGGGSRRTASSFATNTSPPLSSSTRAPAPAPAPAPSRSSSLLAPAAAAAAAYSSSPLLAPSAAAYTGINANGNGAARGASTGTGGASRVDAVIVGAGQAGLSVAYHLQKAGGLRVVALDANQV